MGCTLGSTPWIRTCGWGVGWIFAVLSTLGSGALLDACGGDICWVDGGLFGGIVLGLVVGGVGGSEVLSCIFIVVGSVLSSVVFRISGVGVVGIGVAS